MTDFLSQVPEKYRKFTKPLKYKVEYASELFELESGVSEMMERNWQLQGGVCVCKDEDGEMLYYQALYKPESQPKD